MKQWIRKLILAAPVSMAISLVGHGASANGVPGSAFFVQNGSDIGCLSLNSYSGQQNTCGKFVNVQAYIPNYNGNALALTGFMDNNSWCEAIVTNGVGNAAWFGPFARAGGMNGNKSVQTLQLGSPPVFGGAALVVSCQLEYNSGGGTPTTWIGEVWQ